MHVSVGEALRDAARRIEKIGAQTPLLDAEVLLCHVLSVDRLYLIVNGDKKLTEEQFIRFQKSVEKRLVGVPVQYIIGHQEFMGINFHVEEGVLIPRGDTEILVETVLNWTNKKRPRHESIRIGDIGTGSGAIILSILKFIDNALGYAVDISPKALEIAKKNAELHGITSVTFLQGNLLEPIKEAGVKLDVLVSNPPYIPRKDITGLQVEVACHEPLLALDGGEDGLDFYRILVDEGWPLLKPNGLLALEIGHDQAHRVAELLNENGHYQNIQRVKDLAGIERVITAEAEY